VFKKIFKNSGYTDEQADELLQISALLLHHTQYRIWTSTLVDMITEIRVADLTMFRNVLKRFIATYPASYLRYHGVKIVKTIAQFVQGTLEPPTGKVEQRVYDVLQKEHKGKLKYVDFGLDELPWDRMPNFGNQVQPNN